jgi:hypothetical protein
MHDSLYLVLLCYLPVPPYFPGSLFDRYCFSTGGSNVDEHWSSPEALGTSIHTSFDPQSGGAVNSEGFHTQETCTTYNALKLSRHMLSWSGAASVADAYETKLINGIMGVQQPGVVRSLTYCFLCTWLGLGGQLFLPLSLPPPIAPASPTTYRTLPTSTIPLHCT